MLRAMAKKLRRVGREARAYDGEMESSTSPAVITGLVPVIPITVAMPCLLYRDGRDEPGHDNARLDTIGSCSSPCDLDANGEAGFTLIEVIAGFAILSFAFGILLSVISDGIRRTAGAGAEAAAGALAQSLLAGTGTEAILQSGEGSGRAEPDLQWRMRVEPFDDSADRRQDPTVAYRVTVQVVWHEGADERALVLSTLRLGAREPPR